ncbi:hypothetical protein Hanom_Chr07g00640151 [Helianthus anomalus]
MYRIGVPKHIAIHVTMCKLVCKKVYRILEMHEVMNCVLVFVPRTGTYRDPCDYCQDSPREHLAPCDYCQDSPREHPAPPFRYSVVFSLRFKSPTSSPSVAFFRQNSGHPKQT